MKKWYAVAVSALREERGMVVEVGTRPYAILADSGEAACAFALMNARSVYAEADGWVRHKASAVMVPEREDGAQ